MKAPSKSPRVVDFSTHLSGPIASRHLVQLGADVVKIEHPKVGDGNRQFPPFFHDEGIHHLVLNPGTRSLAVDPGSADWPRIVQAAARWADVVIVGNRPSNAIRLGIDFVSMTRHNNDLVYCLVTGYGVDGEWAGWPAHGLNMDSLAGAVPLEQVDGRPDVPEYFRTAGTTVAGIEAALGIYAALHRRSQGGGGQVVHLSVWESALSWMWRDVATFANLGRQWTPYKELGSRYCVYQTKDQKALLVCPSERHFWQAFCSELGLPHELKERGDWSTGSDMGERYVALGEREVIQEKIFERTRAEWIGRLRQAEIPFAPILDWREAMASPHAQANGVMSEFEYCGNNVRIPVAPVSITPSATLAEGGYEALASAHRDKARNVSRPPTLGENNAEVLRDFGLLD
jgi:crotonobetainyl-CoA:carnitine CoA-transferase CaiB-like acyl-CoA transferase